MFFVFLLSVALHATASTFAQHFYFHEDEVRVSSFFALLHPPAPTALVTSAHTTPLLFRFSFFPRRSPCGQFFSRTVTSCPTLSHCPPPPSHVPSSLCHPFSICSVHCHRFHEPLHLFADVNLCSVLCTFLLAPMLPNCRLRLPRSYGLPSSRPRGSGNGVLLPHPLPVQ